MAIWHYGCHSQMCYGIIRLVYDIMVYVIRALLLSGHSGVSGVGFAI